MVTARSGASSSQVFPAAAEAALGVVDDAVVDGVAVAVDWSASDEMLAADGSGDKA